MKTKTKKLYQKVDVSKSKRFGNQNTNSINVIVNPRTNDESDEDEMYNRNMMRISPSLTSQLNVFRDPGISPQAVNQIQQEGLREDKPVSGQSIREANQQMENQEDAAAIQNAAAQQIQDNVVAGNTGQIMNRLGQIGGQLIAQQMGGGDIAQAIGEAGGAEVMNTLGRLGGEIMGRNRAENEAYKEGYSEAYEEAYKEMPLKIEEFRDAINRNYQDERERFEKELEEQKSRAVSELEASRQETRVLINDVRQQNQELERENRELRDEMRIIDDEEQRLNDVILKDVLTPATPDNFATPTATVSPLMETREEIKRDLDRSGVVVRKQLDFRAQRGEGKKSREDKQNTDKFIQSKKNPDKRVSRKP